MEVNSNKVNLIENIYACQKNMARISDHLAQMMLDIAEMDGEPSLFYASDILSVAHSLTSLERELSRAGHYYNQQRFAMGKQLVVI